MLLNYIFPFIVLLGALVFFHELGHFLFARLFGVGVTTFSLGFGPKIYARKYKGTEYKISWIPLGGFVKMVGEDPNEDVSEEKRAVSFSHKPVWQRALIVGAGPVFNIVLAFVIFIGIFAVGYPRLQPIVGTILPDSPAAISGLTSGDRIVEVNGAAIETWEHLESVIAASNGSSLTLQVERDQDETSRRAVEVTPIRSSKPDIFGQLKESWAVGIGSHIDLPFIGIADSASPAGQAGLKTGDRIIAIDEREIHFTYQLRDALAACAGRSVPLTIYRERPAEEVKQERKSIGCGKAPSHFEKMSLNIEVPDSVTKPDVLDRLGIENTDLYILGVVEGQQAEKAGFLEGDRIFRIGEQIVTEQIDFLNYIRNNADQAAAVTVIRDGRQIPLTVVPELKRRETEQGEALRSGQIGIMIGISQIRGVMEPQRYLNPIKLIGAATAETAHWTKITLKAFYYIFSGNLSPKNLGGPLRIAKMAGDTAQAGLFQYIFLMAVISLNLAFINLVPMPVFDGGHLLLFSIEAIRRKPLQLKTIQVVNWIGVMFIFALIILIFYNDLNFFFPILGEALSQ